MTLPQFVIANDGRYVCAMQATGAGWRTFVRGRRKRDDDRERFVSTNPADVSFVRVEAGETVARYARRFWTFREAAVYLRDRGCRVAACGFYVVKL